METQTSEVPTRMNLLLFSIPIYGNCLGRSYPYHAKKLPHRINWTFAFRQTVIDCRTLKFVLRKKASSYNILASAKQYPFSFFLSDKTTRRLKERLFFGNWWEKRTRSFMQITSYTKQIIKQGD